MEANLRALLAAGARAFINLMEEDEVNREGRPFADYRPALQTLAEELGITVECLRFPIPDFGTPSAERLTAILNAIDDALDRQRLVYVHCWGGKGRTGTVVGCWLARHGVATGAAATRRIKELRRNVPDADQPSPETTAQGELVAAWRPGR